MKRLYSPWRSQYIATFSKPKKAGCLFCRIAKVKNDQKNFVLTRGKLCYAVMNLYPYNSGHVMVVPYKHTSKFEALSEEEYTEVMQLTARLKKGLEKVSHPQGFNFGGNFGRVAGAGIDKHIHFHLVPRWNGDTNFMPVLADTKMISEDMRKTWRELKGALGKNAKL